MLGFPHLQHIKVFRMSRTGLNVPVITVLDDAGHIIEADQRRLIHYVVQDGRGASSLFLSGTTGEFDRITQQQRQRVLAIGCEELRLVNARLPPSCAPIEAWAGVTAPTKAETLENLALAVQLKAEMAVIAPLAINDLPLKELVGFFRRDVAALVPADGSLTISLYDNPDIAVPTTVRHTPVAIIEELRALPFVVSLKASTSRDVMQSYLRAALPNGSPGSLDLYIGNASLLFEFEGMQREAGVDAHKLFFAGVVSGPANLLPCEWAAAWQAAVERDAAALGSYQQAFARFDEMCMFGEGRARASKSIAAIKRALYNRRVISSASVGRGTPALTAPEAAQFDDELATFLAELDRGLGCTSAVSVISS